MMMISKKNHVVSTKVQQRKRPCFSKRSLMAYLSMCAATGVKAATEGSHIQTPLAWNGKDYQVKEMRPDLFQQIRGLYLAQNPEIMKLVAKEAKEEFEKREKGDSEQFYSEDALLEYIKKHLFKGKSRNSAGSGSELRFSPGNGLLLKNLVRGDEGTVSDNKRGPDELFAQKYYEHHFQKNAGCSGMTDYLCILENVNKKGGWINNTKNRDYFVVMGNVYAPGRSETTGNPVIDEYFEKLPWSKVDLKGSCSKRWWAAKGGPELKEIDLINIANGEITIKETETNMEFLKKEFKSMYNGLKFCLELGVTDASHMMEIALLPEWLESEAGEDLEDELLKRRTIVGETKNGTKLLIRPTKILDNFQRINEAKQAIIWDRYYKGLDGKKEGSRINFIQYFHRACAFFDSMFKIERDGDQKGALSMYIDPVKERVQLKTGNPRDRYDDAQDQVYLDYYQRRFNSQYKLKSTEKAKTANTKSRQEAHKKMGKFPLVDGLWEIKQLAQGPKQNVDKIIEAYWSNSELTAKQKQIRSRSFTKLCSDVLYRKNLIPSDEYNTQKILETLRENESEPLQGCLQVIKDFLSFDGVQKDTDWRGRESDLKQSIDGCFTALNAAVNDGPAPTPRRLASDVSSILSTVVVTMISFLVWYMFLRAPTDLVKARRRTTIIKKRPTFVKGKRRESRKPTLSTLRSQSALLN